MPQQILRTNGDVLLIVPLGTATQNVDCNIRLQCVNFSYDEMAMCDIVIYQQAVNTTMQVSWGRKHHTAYNTRFVQLIHLVTPGIPFINTILMKKSTEASYGIRIFVCDVNSHPCLNSTAACLGQR